MAYTRRLYKSSGDKILSGVAGGMAEYFQIDPIFVRLGWIASVFLTGGISILAYIVMIFVVPKGAYKSSASADLITDESGHTSQFPVESEELMRERSERKRYLLGICLVVAGIALLIYNLDILGPIDWGIVGAIAVIATGTCLLAASILKR